MDELLHGEAHSLCLALTPLSGVSSSKVVGGGGAGGCWEAATLPFRHETFLQLSHHDWGLLGKEFGYMHYLQVVGFPEVCLGHCAHQQQPS